MQTLLVSSSNKPVKWQKSLAILVPAVPTQTSTSPTTTTLAFTGCLTTPGRWSFDATVPSMTTLATPTTTTEKRQQTLPSTETSLTTTTQRPTQSVVFVTFRRRRSSAERQASLTSFWTRSTRGSALTSPRRIQFPGLCCCKNAQFAVVQ